MIVVLPLHADTIGDITELKGYGQILRDEPYAATLDFNINSYDDVRTRAGRIGITFLDNSTVKLTEHSKLIIDEYIYDPNPDKSKMALQFASGTIRFTSGAFNKKNVELSTPTANIAVLGTDFTCTVDETGRSLIILLPDEYGDASGEIIVSTATGQVTLNKPYQATTTSVYEANPSKPVTLDITLDMIDNMLIVSPPKEEISNEQTQASQKADYLDFNDLDVDLLNEDFLDTEEDLDFTELDIDYLDVNFLEDLLDVLDDLDEQEEEDQLVAVDGTNIVGTRIGQDGETQITTILQGDQIKFIRSVNQNAQVVVNSDGSYTLILIQDGVSNTVKINGGTSSSITIIQTP
tara:strand:- start:1256 stop:2305 length:1050 start_codon:yes stop_codon:yes gene_type:complete